MSSLSGILNTARNAIFTHQTAVQVASHNVANAQTPGYSRQQVQLSAREPLLMPLGSIGTGVAVSDITRVRDHLADQGVRRESGRAAAFGAQRDVLGQVESIFQEPTELGLAATLDAFWGAWSDLANNPTSGSARVVVRQRGQQVATALNQTAERLEEIRSGVQTRVTHAVDEVNGFVKQIADLNVQIVRAEAGGRTASDLRDARDRLIDSIATRMEVRSTERPDGSLSLVADGINLVDGVTHHSLSVGLSGGRLQVRAGAEVAEASNGGSRLTALTQLYNEDLVQVQGQLDALAAGLVTTVNAIHEAGWAPHDDPTKRTGISFFDPAGGTARSIALSADVLADHRVIAASTNVASELGPGNNQVAQQLAGLRDAPVAIGGRSVPLGAHYRQTVTGVALKVSSAENSATVYETLAQNAEARRASISGVSTDEELVSLIQHQQAYTAATRLVKTVDEMINAILQMV